MAKDKPARTPALMARVRNSMSFRKRAPSDIIPHDPSCSILTEQAGGRPSPIKLDELPVELLQIITSMLEPQEAAALSLVSKSLSRCLRKDYATLLPDSSMCRYRFLWLLERDLPDWLTCWTCYKLYRWRIPDQPCPRLCPGRKLRPHYSYGNLDIQDHDRRIAREEIDLVCRRAESPKAERGLPAKHVLKALQEKERFDRRVRLPISSILRASSYDDGLITISSRTTMRLTSSHPLFSLAFIPDLLTPLPGMPALRFNTLSSVSRWLGINYHLLYSQKAFAKHAEYEFFLCPHCQSSVGLAVSLMPRGAVILKVNTTQCLGSSTELIGGDVGVAGIRTHHRDTMPDKLVNIVSCAAADTGRTPFCLAPTRDVTAGYDGQQDTDLSVYSWLLRHQSDFRQRIWPQSTEGEWGELDADLVSGNMTNMTLDQDGVVKWPLYSNSSWNTHGQAEYYIPLRKRWLGVVFVNAPVKMGQSVKTVVRKLVRRKKGQDSGHPDEAISKQNAGGKA